MIGIGGSKEIKFHPGGKDGGGENPVFFETLLNKRNFFSLLPPLFSHDFAFLGYLTNFMSSRFD